MRIMDDRQDWHAKWQRLKLVAGLAVVGFAVTLAVVVGNRLSDEALAVLAGAACGVGAAIPTSLLIVAVTRRRREEEDRRTNRPVGPGQAGHQAYPPVVVVPPPGGQPWSGGGWNTPPPTLTAPTRRTFTIVGGEDDDWLPDDEW